VAAASIIGLWFAVSVERNIAEMQKGIEQAVRVSALQQKWLAIVGLLDTLSVARANVDTQEQLEARLNELDQELANMSDQPLGLSPEMIAENQKIAQDLQQIGTEMDALVRQIYDYISQNR